jgi:hypothetical protein
MLSACRPARHCLPSASRGAAASPARSGPLPHRLAPVPQLRTSADAHLCARLAIAQRPSFAALTARKMGMKPARIAAAPAQPVRRALTARKMAMKPARIAAVPAPQLVSSTRRLPVIFIACPRCRVAKPTLRSAVQNGAQTTRWASYKVHSLQRHHSQQCGDR